MDLSYPEGNSVNDGISPHWLMLAYLSIDHIVYAILRLGRGTLLKKLDIHSAYWLIPVHCQDDCCWACDGGTDVY